MLSWLKRLVNGEKESAPPALSAPTQPTAPPKAPLVSVTVSVSDPVKKPAGFRSPALAQLWHDVAGISHPEHPFLDSSYSPNSMMPAADFSPWVKDRLSRQESDAIVELLGFIASEHQIMALRNSFQSYDFGRFLDADPDLLHEVHAITLLAYRIPWVGLDENRRWLLVDLFEQSLASHPFRVRQDAVAHLLEGGNKDIRRRNRQRDASAPCEPLLTADVIASCGQSTVCAVGESLRAYPVTFRACVSGSLQRGSASWCALRPNLTGDYTLRQFGLSGSQNSRFYASCGIFEPPSDLRALATHLTKDELLKIASSHGIEIAKSWRKERMMDALLAAEQARTALSARAADSLLQVRADMHGELERWQESLPSFRNLALCLACA